MLSFSNSCSQIRRYALIPGRTSLSLFFASMSLCKQTNRINLRHTFDTPQAHPHKSRAHASWEVINLHVDPDGVCIAGSALHKESI